MRNVNRGLKKLGCAIMYCLVAGAILYALLIWCGHRFVDTMKLQAPASNRK
jgi:hypothetical protein